MGRNAPALVILYGNTQAAGMEPRALATVNALAVIFNASAGAVCGLSLAIIWKALMRWAWWSLAGCLLFLQAAGFASDAFWGSRNLLANVASSLLLLCGLALAATGVFRAAR